MGLMRIQTSRHAAQEGVVRLVPGYRDCLLKGLNIFEESEASLIRDRLSKTNNYNKDDGLDEAPEEIRQIRWFVLPNEALNYFEKCSCQTSVMRDKPSLFVPRMYIPPPDDSNYYKHEYGLNHYSTIPSGFLAKPIIN